MLILIIARAPQRRRRRRRRRIRWEAQGPGIALVFVALWATRHLTPPLPQQSIANNGKKKGGWARHKYLQEIAFRSDTFSSQDLLRMSTGFICTSARKCQGAVSLGGFRGFCSSGFQRFSSGHDACHATSSLRKSCRACPFVRTSLTYLFQQQCGIQSSQRWRHFLVPLSLRWGRCVVPSLDLGPPRNLLQPAMDQHKNLLRHQKKVLCWILDFLWRFFPAIRWHLRAAFIWMGHIQINGCTRQSWTSLSVAYQDLTRKIPPPGQQTKAKKRMTPPPSSAKQGHQKPIQQLLANQPARNGSHNDILKTQASRCHLRWRRKGLQFSAGSSVTRPAPAQNSACVGWTADQFAADRYVGAASEAGQWWRWGVLGCEPTWPQIRQIGSHLGTLALKTENFSKKIGRFSKTRKWIY